MNARAIRAGVCLMLAASGAVIAQERKIDLSAKSVVAAAGAYVDAYSVRMQNVLADETAIQQVMAGDLLQQTRTTKSDLFITFLPAESLWIAVRDVRDVDGAPVDDPDNVRSLIERAPLTRLGSLIAKKNSQYNIGAVSRTFNEPTLALLVLSSKHRERFKFDRESVSQGASPRVTISFKEKARPTLISGTNGAPVYAYGSIVIDPSNGRIESTRLQLKMGSVLAKLETSYNNDEKLKLWVPASMHEVYEQTSRGFEQTVTCVSTYANYRKFETSAIIK